MEYIFEAFQNSFKIGEKVIFITNVKNENKQDGDLMLTSLRLVFYPAKPKEIKDVLFIEIKVIDSIKLTENGLIITSENKKGVYEIDFLKDEFIKKIKEINSDISVIY